MTTTRATEPAPVAGSAPQAAPRRRPLQQALHTISLVCTGLLVIAGLQRWLWLGTLLAAWLPVLIALQAALLAVVRRSAWHRDLALVGLLVATWAGFWQAWRPTAAAVEARADITVATAAWGQLPPAAATLFARTDLAVVRTTSDAVDALVDLANDHGLRHDVVIVLDDPQPRDAQLVELDPEAVTVERGRRHTPQRRSGERSLVILAKQRLERVSRSVVPAPATGGDSGLLAVYRLPLPAPREAVESARSAGSAAAYLEVVAIHLPADADPDSGWAFPGHRMVQAALIEQVASMSTAPVDPARIGQVVVIPQSLPRRDPRLIDLEQHSGLVRPARPESDGWWPGHARDHVLVGPSWQAGPAEAIAGGVVVPMARP